MDFTQTPVTPALFEKSNIYPLSSLVERIPINDFFPSTSPIEVELGSGDGSFLAQYAAKNPAINLVGVERLLGRLRKTDRKSLRRNLKNVRLIRIEAAYFIEWLLPPNSISGLHVYFPDPWPKRKHRKFRLVNERFPEIAHRALKPGSLLHLRTDHQEYAGQMTEVMSSDPRFVPAPIPPDLLEIITDFEAQFLKEGRPIHRASYLKPA